MEIQEKFVRYYLTKTGKCPFEKWLEDLKDVQARAIIRIRIRRCELGNFGQCRWVGDGVHELKINFGPGYRVYFGKEGSSLVILLCGGNKSTQDKDIKIAHAYWADYRRSQ